jgi:hypothetical protein
MLALTITGPACSGHYGTEGLGPDSSWRRIVLLWHLMGLAIGHLAFLPQPG